VTNKINAREIALDMVIDILEKDGYIHKVIYNSLKDYQFLDKRDRAFITRVCNGTVKHYITIDYIINKHASLSTNKMKPLIRNILRTSVFQLFYMDQVPISAICNEAVKISKKRGFNKLSGFVNGILRNISREYSSRSIDVIEFPNKEKETSRYFSIKYSTPLWLVDKIINQYNEQITEEILKDSLKEKHLTIRTNCNLIKPNDLKDNLTNQGLTIEENPDIHYAFKLSNYDYLDKLDDFNLGHFTVQDYSSMLVIEAAGIKDTDFVVDVCAAPGGKSLHAAERAKEVSARDLTEYKINLINENIKRLAINNIKTKVWDACVTDESLIRKADIVIADLPCSGLGVLRKKPDIKYKIKQEQINELVELQRKILTVISDYIKINGILLYSTCTINKEENIENIDWFVNNFDFELENMNDYIPKGYQDENSQKGYLQLLPGAQESDGFFIARLRRKG